MANTCEWKPRFPGDYRLACSDGNGPHDHYTKDGWIDHHPMTVARFNLTDLAKLYDLVRKEWARERLHETRQLMEKVEREIHRLQLETNDYPTG